ncbi:cytochrome c biogenesis CcdA family protein [Thermomicrobiaceae bacterium CFH 74404]|uniref:Cytochrome c biogenesis CcdA family protein n=1 Tax=Thermalbibacter longus TaxID=2951981 RepID=A0AA41WEJ2_9BACT|nr:cytochrome c biogenesis CcdA family protein [Thermalbibacter longus]MCM8747981.1 cytochrome c biogenesis CcdA family protein [Thermalbibacter longus]
MSELQAQAAQWLSTLITWLPVGYAFGAGMIAAVNPCGFAMLPAYLALYLGAGGQADQRSGARRLAEAVVVGGTVSAGFVVLFAAAGAVISAGGRFLLPVMPWVGLAIGVGLVLLGLAMLAGRTFNPALFEQLADRIGRSRERSLRGFFLFGLAYGLASLSCTLPVFMIAAGSALISGSLGRGFVQLLSYGLGMASVVIALTLAIALVKAGFVTLLRRAVPYVQTVAAMLLVVAGGSIVLYWSPYVLQTVR